MLVLKVVLVLVVPLVMRVGTVGNARWYFGGSKDEQCRPMPGSPSTNHGLVRLIKHIFDI